MPGQWKFSLVDFTYFYLCRLIVLLFTSDASFQPQKINIKVDVEDVTGQIKRKVCSYAVIEYRGYQDLF